MVDIAGIVLLEEDSDLILSIKQKNMCSSAFGIFIFYSGNHKKSFRIRIILIIKI